MSKIALVDDDRNILTTLSIALQAEGYATRVYSDGEAALAALDAAELSEPTLKNRQRVVVQRGLRRRQIRHPQAAGLTHQFAHRPPASWGA